MIKKIKFDGLDAVEMSENSWKLVAITEVGPRVGFLGLKEADDNLLFWNTKTEGYEDWKIYGGHRVWLTRPYADESVDTYESDNEVCSVEIDHSESSVTITSPQNNFTKLVKGMKIRMIGDGEFSVTNFITNNGPFIYSAGVWSPTCIDPEGATIRIPLGEEDSTWDLVRIVIPRKFAGNTVKLDDEQISFDGDEMVIEAKGTLTKRCVSAPKGTIYCQWKERNIRFTKQTKYCRDGRYPLDGCNIAAFVGDGNWMAEMETFGVEQSIRPGETISNEEIWRLEKMR